MYLPKLPLEKVHLVLKGLRAPCGAARFIVTTAALPDVCTSRFRAPRRPQQPGSLPSLSEPLPHLTYVLVEGADESGR